MAVSMKDPKMTVLVISFKKLYTEKRIPKKQKAVCICRK